MTSYYVSPGYHMVFRNKSAVSKVLLLFQRCYCCFKGATLLIFHRMIFQVFVFVQLVILYLQWV